MKMILQLTNTVVMRKPATGQKAMPPSSPRNLQAQGHLPAGAAKQPQPSPGRQMQNAHLRPAHMKPQGVPMQVDQLGRTIEVPPNAIAVPQSPRPENLASVNRQPRQGNPSRKMFNNSTWSMKIGA